MNDDSERRDYIGSSDAARILGVDPWTDDSVTVQRIVFGREPEVDEKKERMYRLGKRLERPTLDEFAHETGRKLVFPARKMHPKFSFIGDRVDAMTEEGDCVEAKTCLPFPGVFKKWGVPGSGEVPENYFVQCHHHMMVWGAKRCWVPVLFGTHRFDFYCVERDEQMIQDLLRIEVHFWETRIAPLLSGRMEAVANG